MRQVNFRALRSVHPLIACAVLGILYLLLVSIFPANADSMTQYGWSSTEYHTIYLMIVIPMVATWFAAFYGYNWVRSYAKSIENTAEGDSYRQLANGVGWLALSLPVPTIASLILNSIANAHPGFHASAIIISNYIALILPLFAFAVIGNAARMLTATASIRISLAGARSVIFMFVLLGVAFCYLILKHFDLGSPASNNNPYFMPIWIMLLTIIVPYLYAWFVGLLAAYEFSVLATKTRGVLFSQALKLFALGLVTVIGSSIVLEYISSAAPRSGHLELNGRLLATYVFRIAAGIGFLLIAQGARRLRKIEEV
ncbi:MAG: hypothetical protein JWO41_728 [Candidatus Saccharibacteria bacterium]|nr:hypothetical protein [Candidatus Saccharibacteria bacterium]